MTVAPALIDMMSALVAIPFASSFDPSREEGNQGVIDLLGTWLEGLGFTLELQDLPGRAPRSIR